VESVKTPKQAEVAEKKKQAWMARQQRKAIPDDQQRKLLEKKLDTLDRLLRKPDPAIKPEH